MTRKPRVEYVGAFYHVICRGNQRQVIFRADPDRKFYLQRLEKYRQRYGFILYAYVLMNNHVHLLVETGKIPLSKIMQGLQCTYTSYLKQPAKNKKDFEATRLDVFAIPGPLLTRLNCRIRD